MTLIHHRAYALPLLRTYLRRAGLTGSALLPALGIALSSDFAHAESMDFALERLAKNASECRTSAGTSVSGVACEPDNDAFMSLVNQFGMAVAPTSMYPAHTTGYAGFEISLEGAYTSINNTSDYMKDGTRGPSDDVTGVKSKRNDSPASILQLYSLRLRKGFGFGVETGVAFGFMPNTSIISGGLDLRLAIFEGFRDGIPGYFPDIAVTGSVRTTTGSPQVQLTVVGVSGVISKPITLFETGVLTPWAGYQHLFIYGNSGVVDLTPGENAIQACGLVGPSIPGTRDRDRNDGSPVCSPGGSTSDFANNRIFEPVSIMRQRLLFGMNYRYEILTVGGQVMADVFNSARNMNDDAEAFVFKAEQDEGGNVGNFSFALQLGAQF